MKDVVRKKLGVETSASVYLSQVRDGQSVDLEDGMFATEMGDFIPSLIFHPRQMMTLMHFLHSCKTVGLFK